MMLIYSIFASRYPALAWLLDRDPARDLAGSAFVAAVILAGYVVCRFILGIESRLCRVEADLAGTGSLVTDHGRKIDAVEKTRTQDYEVKAAWVAEVSKDLKHMAADVASMKAEQAAEDRSVAWVDRDRAESKAPPRSGGISDADAKHAAALFAVGQYPPANGYRTAPPPPDEYIGNFGKVIDVDGERAARLNGVTRQRPVDDCHCDRCRGFFARRHGGKPTS
jgi:hypothetical protein